jgi:hypothetical protein
MASDRKLLMRILQLNCYITEEFGFDEVYMMMNGRRIWPKNHTYKSLKAGHTKIDVEIKDLVPDQKLEIEIWDFDFLTSNDLLGKIPVVIDEPGGPYTTDLIPSSEGGGKAKYSLTWEIDFQ